MADVLAEGRQLLTAWNGGRNVSDEIAGFFAAQGEALLAVAEAASHVKAIAVREFTCDCDDPTADDCPWFWNVPNVELDDLFEKVAALNPGDARDHADARPPEGETQG